MDKNKRKLDYLMSFIRTFDILNRYMEIELARYGTKPIRFAVMNAIIVHGGRMSPKAISRWTYRTPHTVTSMLDSLERDGLICREANLNDRRSINVVVTEKGWHGLNKITPAAGEISQKALSCLNEDEFDTISNILRKLRKHLLSEIDKTKCKK